MKKKLTLAALAVGTAFSAASPSVAQDLSQGADNFYESTQLDYKKVTFKNQFNMDVVGNLYTPKTMKEGEKLPALIVGHPMGAVKEQSSNLYAQKMAEKGYVTLAIDL